MDAKKFIDAVSELSDSKGLSRQAIIFALEEALKRAYIKFLGGGDDAIVTCVIDEEKGKIELAQVKKVVEEVEDDYLEISVEDANEGLKKPKYNVGDDYAIVCPVEELSKVTAMAVKNNLRQRLSEAERTMLYEIYKDHIGEMMTGVVEKADERSITVRIDRTSIELSRKELIGDEYFRVGDPIKVYIQEVKSTDNGDAKGRGPQIQATRSSEGFLKRLFEEEIHEIYDGTVVIKAMARQAGVRSKVAVASLNEDVDATGACIGQGGNRIQKVVSQLGNGKNKEKIDVINYSPNIGVFMIEAVRPAVALGLNIEEDDKFAEILIEDGSTPLAMGKFRSNLTLAKKLTGYEIDFVEKSKAEQLGLRFTSVEEWKAKAEEEKKEAERQAYIAKQQEEVARREAERLAKEEAEAAARALEEAKKAEEEAAKKAEEPEPLPEVVIKPVAPKADVRPEEFPASAVNPAAAALAAEKAAREARLAAKAAEQATTNVQTTTTLEDLEKELEEAKEKKTKSGAKTKRPRKITEEEVPTPVAPVTPAVPTMPVYTEEELSAIEAEEAEPYEDNDDYEEDYSDYDDYYDDDRN